MEETTEAGDGSTSLGDALASVGPGRLIAIGTALAVLFTLIAVHSYDSTSGSGSGGGGSAPSGQADAQAAAGPWYPAGYTPSPSDPDIAWAWGQPTSCSELANACWQLNLAFNEDCSTVYGEVSILQGSTAVDYDNDTLGGVSAGQSGVLTFEWITEEDTYGDASARLTQLDCY